ncbi:MAG TPA: toxin-antitoxin system, antitoxin component, Xre family protein [Kamptonema sp.]|nr:toxin-antitoxin system, antitoxin component, Xre family protein [Kamptonema sp.]
MSITQNPETNLMEKIRSLPPDKITVLEDFIDFLLTRSEDRLLIYTGNKLSEAAFAKIWDNPKDAEYDEL